MTQPNVTIRELGRDHLEEASRLLAFLNPQTPQPVIYQRLEEIVSRHPHYQLWGAFIDGYLQAVAGAWVATKIWCGRYLEIDNLVVHPECRSQGIGTLLIEHLTPIARDLGCNVLVLDSYTANHASHRLYHRLGFEIWGFHFIRQLGDPTGNTSA